MAFQLKGRTAAAVPTPPADYAVLFKQTGTELLSLKNPDGSVTSFVPLPADGKIAATYLPSFVDDVLEYANLAALPVTGETGKIYVALDTGRVYRWTGTVYTEIVASPGTTDAITEGVTNLYHTQPRVRSTPLTGIDLVTNTAVTVADSVLSAIGKLWAKIVAHMADTANPHGVTKTQVGLSNADNTSDANKPVSTAQQTALDLKQGTSAKDASGGYAGLTLLKINFKNALNTFTSFLTNAATAARTYTFPDKDITVAGLSDLAALNAVTPTGGTLAVAGAVSASGAVTAGTSLAAASFLNVASGTAYFGKSADLVTGPAANYAAVRGASGIDFAVGSTRYAQLSASGLAVTGALSATGAISGASFSDGYNVFAGAQINRTTGYLELQFEGTAGNDVRMFGNSSAPLLFTPGGIKFPATQNPSADANTLDDCEKGNWTPTCTFGGVAVTCVGTDTKYTKIGRQVTITGLTEITRGAQTGNIVFSGLPLATPSGGLPIAANSNLTPPAGYTTGGLVMNNAGNIYFCGASGTVVLSDANTPTTVFTVFLNFSYFV